MRSRVRVALIGRGVVGCSVLYHLTRFGCSDIMLLQPSELTSCSTWHAAGGLHALNADTNMAALQGYTVGLYRELEQLSGQSRGLYHVGGLTIATAPERMVLLRAEPAKHRYPSHDTEILGQEEIRALSPVTNKDGIISASEWHHRRVLRSGGRHPVGLWTRAITRQARTHRRQAGRAVGLVTSGGYAYNSRRSIAMAMVPRERAIHGKDFHVEILGDRCTAKVTTQPVLNPEDKRMRA